MSGTVRLEHLIEKSHVKCCDFKSKQELEAFGVSNTEGITRTAHRKSDDLGDYLVIEPGSFAYNPYRINVGSIGLTPASITGVVSPAYIVFRVKEKKLIPEVLLDFLKSSEGLRQINKLASGAVRKALRYEDLCEIEFPDISYERQLEILQHKQGFDEQHGKFVSEITHQETLLAQLQQAILQEAIQGKLTADWRATHPATEPAHELLHRIQAEKSRLIAAKKLRPEKPLPKITPEEIPFAIPKTWEWQRLGVLVNIKSGKRIHASDYKEDGVPFLRSGEIGTLGRGGSIKNPLYISRQKYNEIKEGFGIPKPNDILIACIGGSIGNTWIVDEREFYFKDGNLVLLESNDHINTNFLLHYLSSSYFWDNTILNATDSSYNALTIIKLNHALFPLPPLAEQAVIVARVAALSGRVRALAGEIAHTRTHAAHLLQAVLKEAFTPAA